MIVHGWQIAAVFFTVLVASFFSGMAGGGGGYIVLPILIALGLSPQQAVGTAKLSGFGLIFGSVAAFKKRAFNNPQLLLFLVALAAAISLTVPHILKSVSGKSFQIILALIILALVPVALSDKHGLERKEAALSKKIIGSVLMAIVLFIQGVFSGGVGSVNNIILISFFGLSALQASATRRIVTLALNTFIVAALVLSTSFIIYKLAFAGMIGGFIGGYAGSHVAIQKGERFAKLALAIFMVVSGVWLLVTA